jgi:hypothetical protein
MCRAFLVLLSVCVLLQETPSRGDPRPVGAGEVRQRLKANVDGQSWKNRCSFQATIDFELQRGHGAETQRNVTLVRRDGLRFDVAGDFSAVDGKTGEPLESPRNHSFRQLSDGKLWFSRNTNPGRKKLNGAKTADIRAYSTRAIESNQYGFGLDGHFPGNDGKTLAEILLAAEQCQVAPRQIGDVECLEISATTAYGVVAVCLDPQRDSVLVAARVEKAPESRYEGATLGTHAWSTGVESWSAELSEVTVERVGDFWIPASGRIDVKESKGGKANRYVARISRSRIDLAPDFAGSDAFQMDFEEGARVTDWDLPERQIGYIWHHGELLPEGAAGTRGVAGNRQIAVEPEGAKSRVWILLLVNLSFLVVFVAYYLMRRSRAE